MNKYLEKIASLEADNDDVYQDMIPYVQGNHPKYWVSVQKWGQPVWMHVKHNGKQIGVRIKDPAYDNDDDLNPTGSFNYDKVIIHPKYQKQYKHLHLKDGSVLNGADGYKSEYTQ